MTPGSFFPDSDFRTFFLPEFVKMALSSLQDFIQDRVKQMLSILVNGDTQAVESDSTVADLLKQLKMNPRFLAVELNRRVVPRAEHGRTKLSADDQIEIVTLVGGG